MSRVVRDVYFVHNGVGTEVLALRIVRRPVSNVTVELRTSAVLGEN